MLLSNPHKAWDMTGDAGTITPNKSKHELLGPVEEQEVRSSLGKASQGRGAWKIAHKVCNHQGGMVPVAWEARAGAVPDHAVYMHMHMHS